MRSPVASSLHQVAEALVGVAHHGRLRGQDLFATLIELGTVDADLRQAHLLLDHRRGVEHREDLLSGYLERQEVTRTGPGGRRAVLVDRLVVQGLLIREHFALKTELHGARPDPGPERAVDPDRTAVEVAARDGGGRFELDHPAVAAVDRIRAAERIAILLGEQDLERHRRGFLRLNERQLRNLLAAPADTVDVEALPGPVERLALAEEELPLEGRLDGLNARGRLETQCRGVDRLVAQEATGLPVLERLQPAQDLFDRDLALGSDRDLFGEAFELGRRGPFQAQELDRLRLHQAQLHRGRGAPGLGERRRGAAREVDAHRGAQLRIGDGEDERLTSGDIGGQHDPQAEILPADEAPRGAARRCRAGIGLDLAAELVGEDLERSEIGRGRRGGAQEGDADAARRPARHFGHTQPGVGRELGRRQGDGPAGVEAGEVGEGRGERLVIGRSDGDAVDVGRDAFTVPESEPGGISGQGAGENARLRLGAGEGDRHPLDEKGMSAGLDRTPAVPLPDDLVVGLWRREAGELDGGVDLVLESVEMVEKGSRGREVEAYPRRRSGRRQPVRGGRRGRAVERRIPGDEEDRLLLESGSGFDSRCGDERIVDQNAGADSARRLLGEERAARKGREGRQGRNEDS